MKTEKSAPHWMVPLAIAVAVGLLLAWSGLNDWRPFSGSTSGTALSPGAVASAVDPTPPSASTSAMATLEGSATSSPPVAAASSAIVQNGTTKILLSDVPREWFVKRYYNGGWQPVRINGVDYPNAYSYDFSNCSSCSNTDVLQVPARLVRVAGQFGLNDQSRHDKVIDGVVFVSIYANDALVFGPTRVEYPQVVAFDLNLTGSNVSRLGLKVDGGTNYEYPSWVGVILTTATPVEVK